MQNYFYYVSENITNQFLGPRVRIKKQSKLIEVATPTINSISKGYRLYFQHEDNWKKLEEKIVNADGGPVIFCICFGPLYRPCALAQFDVSLDSGI